MLKFGRLGRTEALSEGVRDCARASRAKSRPPFCRVSCGGVSEAGSWRSPSGLSDCAVSEHCSAPSTLSSSWMRYSSGTCVGGIRSPVPEELAPSWPSPRLRDCANLCRTASASDPIWFDRADSEPESGNPGLPPERTWTAGEPRSYGSGSYRPETDGAEDEGGVALNGPRFTVLGTVRE